MSSALKLLIYIRPRARLALWFRKKGSAKLLLQSGYTVTIQKLWTTMFLARVWVRNSSVEACRIARMACSTVLILYNRNSFKWSCYSTAKSCDDNKCFRKLSTSLTSWTYLNWHFQKRNRAGTTVGVQSKKIVRVAKKSGQKHDTETWKIPTKPSAVRCQQFNRMLYPCWNV